MRKSQIKLLENDIISRPAHYIEGRAIEPISVIEEFGLCHHLACVVKYIARAGRKTSLLNDLRKAEWYLDREIMRCHSITGPCVPYLYAGPSLLIQEILKDWKLGAYLEPVLSYILAATLALKGHCSHKRIRTYASSLTKARSYLELAIAGYERGDSK
jgi:hypothetical protein